jgi:hypothetical protein
MLHFLSGVMNRCAKCGATTEGGQFYRFFYGAFVGPPESQPAAEGQRVEPGPVFQARGSEEVYYCDRCLIRAAARAQLLRSSLFLVLGLFAIVVVVFLLLISSPGLWAGIVALLVAATLGWVAYQRYRHLRAHLSGSSQDQVRQAVNSDSVIQNMGDEWAIACRRQALQQAGAESFLTRRDYSFWSGPGEQA